MKNTETRLLKRTDVVGNFAWLFLGLLAVCVPGTAQAGIISLASEGTFVDADESNSVGATVGINPHELWFGPLTDADHPGWVGSPETSSWVSFDATGDPSGSAYSAVPNTTVISFFDEFFLVSTPTDGAITVLADDSVAVWLNGSLLMAEATAVGNNYDVCSDFAIGCLEKTKSTLDLTPFLQQGTNTLQFDVAQRRGASFGLNYIGQVTSVPEPATLLLLGSGLTLFCLRRRRRRKKGSPRHE